MHWIDWTVLLGTIAAIVGYGSWKTRKNRDINSFLKGDNEMRWYTIGLSIMATQASAITFLSTPGQAYESGMGFIQFYFGLPIAMIIVSAVFLPIYYKLNVYTAYEYLEQRFDIRIRLFTAFLFLVSRGLAAGITIYAPSIILSTVLGWDLTITNIVVGVLVIVYTVSGGTRAVSLTQTWQMAIILIGMGVAFSIIVSMLPQEISFLEKELLDYQEKKLQNEEKAKKEKKSSNEKKSFTAVVEISAGTNKKYEYNYSKESFEVEIINAGGAEPADWTKITL